MDVNLIQDIEALFSPETIPNPHIAYAAARRHGNLIPIAELQTVVAFGLDDVNALFKHPNVSSDRLGEPTDSSFGARLMRPMMLFHDHASHARLRGLVAQAFTPTAVAQTKEIIAAVCDELLREHAQRGGDFISNVAVPFPLRVIAKLLGLEQIDQIAFRRWADGLAVLLDDQPLEETQAQQMADDLTQMQMYFRKSADELRTSNHPGVLGAMARAEYQGQRLSSDELVSNAALMVSAGFETTTYLIAGSMLAFSQFPEQWQLLREQPELVVNATEECLRFVSPVQLTSRIVSTAFEHNGVEMSAGSQVTLMLGAANRDPQRFTDPETFQINRANANKHLAFASGPHYCLGAPLARLEMQVFLECLMAKYPDFHVPEQALEYRPNFAVRGLVRLEVELEGNRAGLR